MIRLSSIIKTFEPGFLDQYQGQIQPSHRQARNFGFLRPNSKRLIRLLQLLVGLDPTRALALIKKRPALLCPCCGAKMKIIETRLPPLFTVEAPGST